MEDEWTPPFVEQPPKINGVELWDCDDYLCPYVQTSEDKIEKALGRVIFNQTDVFYDLGCGDGRTLFKAIEHGCPKAVGVDIDPTFVADLRTRIEEAGLTDKISVIEGSMLDIDFSEMTVLFIYLLPKATSILEGLLESAFSTGRLRFIMSNSFSIKNFPVAGEFDSDICFYYYDKNRA